MCLLNARRVSDRVVRSHCPPSVSESPKRNAVPHPSLPAIFRAGVRAVLAGARGARAEARALGGVAGVLLCVELDPGGAPLGVRGDRLHRRGAPDATGSELEVAVVECGDQPGGVGGVQVRGLLRGVGGGAGLSAGGRAGCAELGAGVAARNLVLHVSEHELHDRHVPGEVSAVCVVPRLPRVYRGIPSADRRADRARGPLP